ncbi:ABC transporter ATP-binding protein [Nocardia jinanensis]|uniref:ABC transporter ATP-binding protein n=1 Tax=Nocardia jinanensis TaxID=382504 RepID=A0A917RW09_9NOCA|nr:ABC transporter ATP-binding protein [Nocardia jinanensis]GGL38311.1 ABC transporter ATP-binding protein [Nocardia jinanensis]
MIRHLYRLWPHPGTLLRLGALHAVLAVLQGLLLGLLVPILRALLRTEPDFAAAEPWLIAGGCGLVAYAALTVLATPVGFAASMELAAQLRRHLMRHVTTLPLGWFTAENKTRLGRTITTSAGGVAQLTVTIGAPAITSVLVPVTITVVTFFVDWRLALFFVAVAVVALLALRRAGRISAIAEVELERAGIEIAGRAVEFGQAQPVLRAAGHSHTGTDAMHNALAQHRSTYRRGLRRSMLPDLSFTAVVMAGFAVMLTLGAGFLLDTTTAVADTVALLVLAVRFLEPLGNLIELNGALHALDNNIGRVEAVLRTPALPAPADPIGHVPDATIEFDEVTFRYGDTVALSRVSFRCEPGTMTALVGPSGSGKTTVTRLIARFFDTDEGRVRVGGIDVRDYDQEVLLNEIAIVFQDVYLFDTTIEENVLLARPEATRAELAEAARAARLDEVVERLPDGWQTRVGEGGAQLSGGERQRVSIARAFLKRARIVLIDEATSALDPHNEQAIAAAVADLAADPERTLVVIAHRPATLAAADRVVALVSGRVRESGPPEALRETDGIFARLESQYASAHSWRVTAPRVAGSNP